MVGDATDAFDSSDNSFLKWKSWIVGYLHCLQPKI